MLRMPQCVMVIGPTCRRYKDYSVREYKPFVVAEVNVNTDACKRDSAFRTLAKYLFGGNAEQQSLSMTTPVITSGNAMQFVLPVASKADAPTPIPAEAQQTGSSVVVKEVCSRCDVRVPPKARPRRRCAALHRARCGRCHSSAAPMAVRCTC